MIDKQDKTNISLCAALSVRPGINAVIGGGGKTTLLKKLAAEISGPSIQGSRPTVILCTSTHIYPFLEYPCIEAFPDGNCRLKAASQEDPEETSPKPGAFQMHGSRKNAAKNTPASITALIREAFLLSPVICVGTLEKISGKCTAPPLSFRELSGLADYVLVEADGSKGHPFKAHAAYEPVIPKGTGRTILVTGASAFMRPIGKAVHRPEIFLSKLNSYLNGGTCNCGLPDDPLTPESLLTPELAAAYINMEGFADICLLTQTDLLCHNDASGIISPKGKLGTESLNSGNPSPEDLLQRFREFLSIPLVTAPI